MAKTAKRVKGRAVKTATRRPRARVRDAEVVETAAPGTMSLVIRDPASLLPRAEVVDAVTLGDNPTVGSLGLVEATLTAQENAVLDEEVNGALVHVKPTGEVYYSHPAYTQLFNRAFGRLGWSVVPIGVAREKDGLVVVPYVMTIHGRRVAMAYGEQQYSATNRRQSYGEAVEATVASALRRFAKRLGTSLELWDKRFTSNFLATHGVMVKVRKRNGEIEDQWRRKDDPPLPYEQGRSGDGRREEPPSGSAEARPSFTHANAAEPITDGQRRKLWATLKGAGRDENEFRGWLRIKFGIEHSREIKRKDFQTILDAVERPGVLAP